ncbi:hypothetical protein HMPREF9103_00195 [Lentilactobacillus parafarraginis F0439]|uniref:Uncharacterized protein n=1 Tax=Lentilactobacillus parafarraginis F0439 TaxID=797515 RepID=G9ZKE7_9LACO|nr:hypothetical protein HMPREF9103_00195 [Lentilactobacillus parafarraginis F0439]
MAKHKYINFYHKNSSYHCNFSQVLPKIFHSISNRNGKFTLENSMPLYSPFL